MTETASVILGFIDIGIDQFLMTHHLLAIYECSSYKIRGLENFSFSAFRSFNFDSVVRKRNKSSERNIIITTSKRWKLALQLSDSFLLILIFSPH